MSVPLDRLYNYLDDIVNYNLLIYSWLPHGSTKLEHLQMVKDSISPEDWKVLRSTLPMDQFKAVVQRNDHAVMICHDQEPLNSNRYTMADFAADIKRRHLNYKRDLQLEKIANDNVVDYCASLGFRGCANPTNHYDLTILLHSEQNSPHVPVYQRQGYVPVYYWSHGIIALDWFRYAQHDPDLVFDVNNIQKDFLVYNRAWSGTREYRLNFAQQILENDLVNSCRMSFSAVDSNHYSTHQFVNLNLQIHRHDLENFFPVNQYNANASADYVNTDYASTGIEVVLETLFDDARWHLTEKSLRPIACGKPFILAATAGSLQYLRQYGFKTFSGLIDESYDSITDPLQRLNAIVKEMSRISNLPGSEKTTLFHRLDHIARYNQRHFFNAFHDIVIKEYENNMAEAMSIMNHSRTGKHDRFIQQLMQ